MQAQKGGAGLPFEAVMTRGWWFSRQPAPRRRNPMTDGLSVFMPLNSRLATLYTRPHDTIR